MTHAHGPAGHGHRECATPPPPPGTVDLEQLRQRAEAEERRRREARAAAGDPDGAIDPVTEVTAANLETAVVLRSEEVPVLVLIGAPGAPETVRMRADLEEMVRAADLGWLLGVVDADAEFQVAQAFGVRMLPTLVAVAGGAPIGQAEGEKPREFLEQWATAVLDAVAGRLRGLPAGARMRGAGEESEAAAEPDAPTDDPRLAEAEEALAEGDFDRAIAVYDAILDSEPGNAALLAARTNVAFLARAQRLERTVDHVARAEADPGDVDAALDAADQQMLLGEAGPCLDRLLAALAGSAGEDRKRVHARLLEMLRLFDPADPLALDARRRMASALF